MAFIGGYLHKLFIAGVEVEGEMEIGAVEGFDIRTIKNNKILHLLALSTAHIS